MQQLLADLQRRIPELSPKLRQAAQLVLDRPALVATGSMREFARQAGVTPPTLERLASTLGFQNYSNFKSRFRTAIDSFDYAQRANQLQTTHELTGEAGITAELRKAAHRNIDNYFENLHLDAICEAADLMISAHSVYVIGANAPHWMAAYMQYVGKMVLPEMRVPPTSGAGLVEGLIPLTSNDTVLAMTYRPYAKQTIEAIDFTLNQGAALIYLTDSVSAPLVEKATVVIRQSTDSPQYFPSMVSVVTAIETLLAVVVARSSNEAVSNIATYAKLRQSRYIAP